VKDLVNFAKVNIHDLKLEMLQLFIDFLGKNYDIDQDDLDRHSAVDGFANLVEDIHESVSQIEFLFTQKNYQKLPG
jgi:hypothetical protein